MSNVIKARELTVGKMQDGDVRYTVAWSVYNVGTQFFIAADCPVMIEKMGTATLCLSNKNGNIYFDGDGEYKREEQRDSYGKLFTVVHDNRDKFTHSPLPEEVRFIEVYESNP